LFLILRNRCFAERRRTRWESGLENVAEVAAPEQTESELERSEVVRSVQRALLRLTAEQREVFVLKHVEGLSYEEIAGRLSTTVAALKMRMHRAYDRLRDLLEAP
jgi:RNA polymerase sigma-70 factor (ECF subfamily)